VETFRRGKLDYFFAYPEDYSQQSVNGWTAILRVGPTTLLLK
jgi:hypothetical protein